MQPAAFIDDPNWANFLPEMREAPRKRHLPTHEDCSRVPPEEAVAHLMKGGTLGRLPNYEERPGQLDMLSAIARAYNAREHLMVEAGTGVGKSLAYLVPSILWAWTNDTPVVVSTATRNLQSQLIASDIPKAVQVLGEDAGKFKVALLKGRGNYLCLRAVSEFFAAGYWTMSAEEQAEMPHFIEWLQTTPDGDLDSYDGLPRQQLSCPGEECSGRRCPFYSRCFVYWARKRAAEAHLVVANHALVLAESASGGGTILPPYGRLVLDEAHNLESIATDYLSFEFSMPELSRLMNRLMRKGRGKRAAPGGILASVQRQLQKGILSGSASGEHVRRLLTDATGLTVRILSAAEDVFDLCALLLKPIRDGQIARYKVSEGKRRFSVRGLFQEYPEEIWDEDNLFAAQTRLENELAAMVNLLHDLRDTLADAAPEEPFNSLADLAAQLNGIAESFVGFANEANFVLKGEKDTHAYWVEKVRLEKRRAHIRLVAAPLSVAEDLNRILYDVKDSVVLSSATLRVGNDFKYMARRLGFFVQKTEGDESRFKSFAATSPFNYLMQSLVLAPDCLPDPSGNPAGYAESLAAFLKDLFTATNGRALVLFTSYEMMNAVAEFAHGPLIEAGIQLLVQGEGLSREAMTHALREGSANPNTQTPANTQKPIVLFGSQSFWEGVDVAGEALSCVVIARLPFQMVGDPIVEARSEQIDRNGGSSFRDYALPEAVIKFRQGFGRLIRSKRDRGVVVVTDPRIVTKNYGGSFRKSIPTSVHTVTELPELLSRVTDFFS